MTLMFTESIINIPFTENILIAYEDRGGNYNFHYSYEKVINYFYKSTHSKTSDIRTESKNHTFVFLEPDYGSFSIRVDFDKDNAVRFIKSKLQDFEDRFIRFLLESTK